MECKYCENDIDEDSSFCKHCGRIVEKTEKTNWEGDGFDLNTDFRGT